MRRVLQKWLMKWGKLWHKHMVGLREGNLSGEKQPQFSSFLLNTKRATRVSTLPHKINNHKCAIYCTYLLWSRQCHSFSSPINYKVQQLHRIQYEETSRNKNHKLLNSNESIYANEFKNEKWNIKLQKKIYKREKDICDSQKIQLYRFIKATTFTRISLPLNQWYIVLVCLNSQSNFPNVEWIFQLD